ncbi:MAG: AI-2E family transporter [Oscillospiraceae bacterium]|nr:AI-2E family transporter [Oscillospiraceae bacterium]
MELNKKNTKRILLIIAFTAFLFWAALNIGAIYHAVKRALSIISPFLGGIFVAFIINVLLRPIEKLWRFIWRKAKKKTIAKKLMRPVCLILSIAIVFGVIFALLFVIVPQIEDTVVSLAKKLPDYISKLLTLWDKVVDFFAERSIEIPQPKLNSEEISNKIIDLIKSHGYTVFDKTVDITSSIVSVVVKAGLALVFSVYALSQKEKLTAQARKLLRATLSEKNVKRVNHVIVLVNRTFTNFVTGQLTEAVVIGTLCFIGMLIFRFPYAAIVSVLVCFTALIPVFGAFIGTAIGAFFILFVSPIKAFWFIIFIIILQLFETNLIYPKVVGHSVGLPGIWVLAAVTIGGTWGVIGMFLSVPICAVLYVLLREYINGKLKGRKVSGKKKAAICAPEENTEMIQEESAAENEKE